MFRWSSSLRLSVRFLYTRIATTDPVLDQLKNSTNKYRIFQLVGVHRPVLTLEHVTCAMNLLWQFHKENPKKLSVCYIREHPEFVSLCTVVENNIDLMDDRELVNILSIVDSFRVDAHSSLMQRLVTEGWRRLQRLDLPSLSTFATCLRRQDMTTSPLMGQIANIVDACLDNLEDPVTISSFATSLYAVSSPHLWERLIRKTESSLEKLNASHFDNVLQLMIVIRNKRNNFPLIKKCDSLLYKNAGAFDLQTIYRIMRMYSFMRFFKFEFVIAGRVKLIEEVDRCDHPVCFVDLFVVLGPIVSFKIRERLEEKLLNMEDKMSVIDLYDVLKTMDYMQCRNPVLIQKICSGLQKHLRAFSLHQLCNIAESLVLLDFKGYSLHTELQMHLKRCILSSFTPSEVAHILRALFLLSPSQIDEVVLSKLHDIIPQSNFNSLSLMTFVVTQLLQSTNKLCSRSLSNLREELCRYSLERLNGAKCLDLFLHELQTKDDVLQMDMALKEATLQTCQRLMHQVNWNSVMQLSFLVLRINTSCSPLMERIAAVTLDNLDKIAPSSVYPILSVFSYMNLKPSQGEDFFNACTQLVVNHIDSLSPYYLVLIVYSLAVAGYFPKELINAIFNTNFLLRFDAQLDAFEKGMKSKLRHYLMALNRAVCIEHPEYEVPWFHEQYCQQMSHREQLSDPQMLLLHKQIFGDTNYTKISVRSPYFYYIAFEYILDKKGNPIAYVEESALTPASSSVFEPDSQMQENKPLPAEAQRIAVDLLSFGALLQNSCHVKGAATMKKRHLEILGYQVVQTAKLHEAAGTVPAQQKSLLRDLHEQKMNVFNL